MDKISFQVQLSSASLADDIPKLKLERIETPIVAVTKQRTVAEIVEMVRRYESILSSKKICGKRGLPLLRFAENRVEEAQLKIPALKAAFQDHYDLEFHFIGKLQSRKIRSVAELFDVVQSVENLDQAKKLDREAGLLSKDSRIFLEVNLAGLSGRSGCSPEDAESIAQELQRLPHLNLCGVMGLTEPLSKTSAQAVRALFKILKTLQLKLGLLECSMGMSEDYDLALQEGSTLLRLGRILF